MLCFLRFLGFPGFLEFNIRHYRFQEKVPSCGCVYSAWPGTAKRAHDPEDPGAVCVTIARSILVGPTLTTARFSVPKASPGPPPDHFLEEVN